MTHEITSRAEAKAAAATRYITGKQCKHGHSAWRYTSTGQCSECVRAMKLDWQKENPELHRAGASRRTKRWGEKNKAHKSATGRTWRQKNPQAVRAHVINRRALRACATPAWFGELDELVVIEAADLCMRRQVATGFSWHADHMLPLQGRGVCGLHVGLNLQVIPAAMNVAKGNKMQLTEPMQWLRAI